MTSHRPLHPAPHPGHPSPPPRYTFGIELETEYQPNFDKIGEALEVPKGKGSTAEEYEGSVREYLSRKYNFNEDRYDLQSLKKEYSFDENRLHDKEYLKIFNFDRSTMGALGDKPGEKLIDQLRKDIHKVNRKAIQRIIAAILTKGDIESYAEKSYSEKPGRKYEITSITSDSSIREHSWRSCKFPIFTNDYISFILIIF